MESTVTDGFLLDASGKQLSDSAPVTTRDVPLSSLEQVLELVADVPEVLPSEIVKRMEREIGEKA